jgi:hypothetical protein
MYFGYVTFYITLPAGVTDVLGLPAQRTYIVKDIQEGGSKAIFCPYRVKLQDVSTVLDDSFCVYASSARPLAIGQTIDLAGKESIFGLRFSNMRVHR